MLIVADGAHWVADTDLRVKQQSGVIRRPWGSSVAGQKHGCDVGTGGCESRESLRVETRESRPFFTHTSTQQPQLLGRTGSAGQASQASGLLACREAPLADPWQTLADPGGRLTSSLGCPRPMATHHGLLLGLPRPSIGTDLAARSAATSRQSLAAESSPPRPNLRPALSTAPFEPQPPVQQSRKTPEIMKTFPAFYSRPHTLSFWDALSWTLSFRRRSLGRTSQPSWIYPRFHPLPLIVLRKMMPCHGVSHINRSTPTFHFVSGSGFASCLSFSRTRHAQAWP